MTTDAKLLADLIPTTWLDPLLSGPAAVVGSPPYGCKDVERILAALKLRIAKAESAREYVPSEPPRILPAVWDGTIRFDSDCTINGVEIKAGTVLKAGLPISGSGR